MSGLTEVSWPTICIEFWHLIYRFWTNFKPDSAPNDPWRQINYAVEPANFATLNNDIKDRKGVFLYRYWTGHLVGTTILLSVFRNLETASMATRNIVLITLFAYTLSWARRFGTGSAIRSVSSW